MTANSFRRAALLVLFGLGLTAYAAYLHRL